METKSAKVTPTLTASFSSSSSSTSSEKMNYALQVALQTMKERCIELQRRVSSMEEENLRLRVGSGSLNNSNQDQSDVLLLRSKVDELQRQKKQLEDQISMVSNENRTLWSHLSKISKDQAQAANEDARLTTTSHIRSAGSASIGANQNLIRSKTFTQHSPNPQLRQKMITEIGFEEIALHEEELGYPFVQPVEGSDGINELDTNIDAKLCMEGLQELRREAMKQQQELKSALTRLETRTALQPCPECTLKASSKPEMADKSLETEDRLVNENKRYQAEQITNQVPDSTPILPLARLNIIQEKLKADAIDKTCPMCGKLYSSQVSFKAFQEHVEMHFIDDTAEVDGSMDRQFEFISHAVGDF